MLIQRRALGNLLELLETEPLILVEGPPRCGLSAFAAQIAHVTPRESLLVDARSPQGRNILADPGAALRELSRGERAARILVADDADEAAAAAARDALSLKDQGERLRFVLLGRGFSRAGPGARLALGPLSLPEVGAGSRTSHWLRGGFPEAFAAPSDAAAASWLARYAESISEERFAAAGLPWAPGRSRALLCMIAEAQGGALNESAAARSLGLSRPTVARAAASLERAGLLRSLPCLAPPDGRRAPRSPALYLRDSGLYNALSGIGSVEALLGSARLAASWEGYAIEQLAAVLPEGVSAARYATRSGAGLELVLSRGGSVLAAAAIRWARPAGPGRAAAAAAEELGATRRWLVLPEAEEREIGGGFLAMSLARAIELAADLG